MKAEEYQRMHDMEDHYWWFRGRRRLALSLLHKHVPPTQGRPDILDLGCGTGVVLGELNKRSNVVGLDFSRLALQFSAGRGLGKLIEANAETLPLQPMRFDGVIALDIVEHIRDDRAAVEEVFRVLRPGGVFVLSVPAFMSLWGPHDVALMHYRRYTAREMRRLLEDAGFKIERLSYSVFFLFPVVAIVRFFEKRKKGEPTASLAKLPGFVNALLVAIQTVEAWIISLISLPWGSSVVAVAERPFDE